MIKCSGFSGFLKQKERKMKIFGPKGAALTALIEGNFNEPAVIDYVRTLTTQLEASQPFPKTGVGVIGVIVSITGNTLVIRQPQFQNSPGTGVLLFQEKHLPFGSAGSEVTVVVGPGTRTPTPGGIKELKPGMTVLAGGNVADGKLGAAFISEAPSSSPAPHPGSPPNPSVNPASRSVRTASKAGGASDLTDTLTFTAQDGFPGIGWNRTASFGLGGLNFTVQLQINAGVGIESHWPMPISVAPQGTVAKGTPVTMDVSVQPGSANPTFLSNVGGGIGISVSVCVPWWLGGGCYQIFSLTQGLGLSNETNAPGPLCNQTQNIPSVFCCVIPVGYDSISFDVHVCAVMTLTGAAVTADACGENFSLCPNNQLGCTPNECPWTLQMANLSYNPQLSYGLQMSIPQVGFSTGDIILESGTVNPTPNPGTLQFTFECPPPPSYIYRCVWNGREETLTWVPNANVEQFGTPANPATCSEFSTNDPRYSCLNGETINVWTAPAQYPGVYVVHNGNQGPQCTYGTWTFPM